MDAEQTLGHVKELGAARAAKHYEANKDAINQKRREAYLKKKATSVPDTKPDDSKAKHDIEFDEIIKGINELDINY
jgi:hypothetical protein